MALNRLTVALLVAAALFAVEVAAVSLVQGRNEPEALALPAPRAGDEALYGARQVRFDDRWGPVPYVLNHVQAAWTTGQAIDGTGALHDVLALRLVANYTWNDPVFLSSVYQDVLYDATSRAVVQVTTHENVPEVIGTNLVNGNIGLGTQQVSLTPTAPTDVWSRTTQARDQLGPCGFWTAAHGARLSLEGPVRLGGSCDNDKPTGDLFRFVGREPVGDLQAYRFDNVNDTQVRVWYADGVAFPVKVRDHFTDLLRPEITNGWVFEWTLQGVRQGSPAPPVQGEALPRPLPVGPLREGAPDESGASVPLPLAAALDALREQDAAFTRFLDDPDVYLGFGWLQAMEDGSGRLAWTWSLLATDGDAWMAREVHRDPADPRLEAVSALVPTPLRVEPWDVDLPNSLEGIYPRMDQVAPGLPRVADAFAAFRATPFRTGEREPERYSFAHQCWGDCDQPRDTLTVGVLRYGDEVRVAMVEGPITPPPEHRQSLRFGDDGHVDFHVERTENLTAQPLDPVTDLKGEGDVEGTPLVASAWLPPGGATLAVLAGGALAGGALALLWPSFKALAAGLFSRIQDDDLLRHPGRARIVQAIEADPGLHLSELRRRTNHAPGALRHHLAKLQAAGLVVAKPLNGYLCYFAPGTSRNAQALSNAAARSEGARKVLEAVQGGHTGVREIAAHTGLAPSTVSHHLARLRQASEGTPAAAS